MIKNTDLTGKVAFDANSLNALKRAAKDNTPEATKEVAKQFEAVFMNMMLKSMRDATPQDNPFDNEQSRTFTSMLDQQLSTNLSSKGLGLSDILAKQLSKGSDIANTTLEQAVTDPESTPETLLNHNTTIDPLKLNSLNSSNVGLIQAYLANQKNTAPVNPSNASPTNASSQTAPTQIKLDEKKPAADIVIDPYKNNKKTTGVLSNSADFKSRMTAHAEEASRSTGIPSKLMLGQAALESGWGKREIKAKDGTPSYNLFGIKATSSWKGKVVETVTTEYVNGEKQKHVTKFRAYDSYADSFKDFAKLMTNNPRYENVMSNLHSADSYAQAMQKAGYATDPNYANKLASVIQRVSTA